MVAQDGREARTAALYAALTEFERLAVLVPLAPGIEERLAVAAAAGARYQRLRTVLDLVGGSPAQAGRGVAAAGGTAVTAPVDEALRRTEPGDWWEAVVAASLCAALSDELFAALTEDAQPTPQDRVEAEGDAFSDGDAAAAVEALGALGASADPRDAVIAAIPEQRLREALAADPVLSARLALWGRRVVGESIVLARVFGGDRYPELADRLALAHEARLEALGLADAA